MELGSRKALKWLVLLWSPFILGRLGKQLKLSFGALQSLSEISQWEHLILVSVVSPLAACFGTFSPSSPKSKNTSPTSFCSDHVAPYQEDLLHIFPLKIKPTCLHVQSPHLAQRMKRGPLSHNGWRYIALNTALHSGDMGCFHHPLLGMNQCESDPSLLCP